MDAAGEYQGHRVVQAAFVCLACGAPALDLSAVPEEMAALAREQAGPVPTDVLCPSCETPVSVWPGEDCPSCGAPLEVG